MIEGADLLLLLLLALLGLGALVVSMWLERYF
jgi:hypothetical protein